MNAETRQKISIGKRITKTALAAAVSYFVAYKIGLQFTPLASIAAIVCMQPTVHESFSASRNRFFATFIGSLLGVALQYIHPGSTIFMGVGVLLMLYICKLFNWKDASALACIILVTIMAGGSLVLDEIVWGAVDRLVNTFIGIVVALIINIAIPPTYIHGSLLVKIRRLFVTNCRLLQEALHLLSENNTDNATFNTMKIQMMELYENTMKELKLFRQERAYLRLDANTARLFETLMESFSLTAMYITQIVLDMQSKNLYMALPDEFRYTLKQLNNELSTIDINYTNVQTEQLFEDCKAYIADLEAFVYEHEKNYTLEQNAYMLALISNLKFVCVSNAPVGIKDLVISEKMKKKMLKQL